MISFIVISGGQRPTAIARLFDSVKAQSIPAYEMIVVGELTGAAPPDCVYIEKPELARTAAICQMRNIGLDAAKGDPAILLDDDIELSQTWYRDMRDYLDSGFDVASHRVTLPNGKRWYDWNVASRTDPLSPTLMIPYDHTGQDVYISGCLMIISRHVFEKVRFNENLLNHQRDDVEFCHRVWDAGYTIKFFEKPSAVHYLEPSGRSESDPASGTALLSEGIHLYRMERYGEAVRLFESVIASGSESVRAFYHKALCLMNMGDAEGAAESFKQVIQTAGISDKDARRLYFTACFHLGAIYEVAGNTGEARKMYETALTGMPEHRKTAEGVQRLSAKS
ncbi:MAG: tetratricopeptide repeat protein [Nitrospinae bacterium]|nr:tetratricopeptide repeat protein [Nitrospinota bacterium]